MALIGVMALTGCGFQLKGTGSNNAQLQGMTIRLISNQPRAELTREVSRELTANGLVLTDDDESHLSLHLEPEQFTQRNVSLTAQARAAELELTLSAAFTLTESEQEPIDGGDVLGGALVSSRWFLSQYTSMDSGVFVVAWGETCKNRCYDSGLSVFDYGGAA